MKYEGPYIMILEVSETDFLLSMSEIGPGAGDAGSPGFGAKKSSVWDEVKQYNINKEEQNYED